MVTSASALSRVCFKVLGRRRRNHEKPHRKRPCRLGWSRPLRSNSWPSVSVPSSSLARASDHPPTVISPPPSFPLFIVGRRLIKRCDKEQKQDGEELRKKDHDGYPSRECCCC